MKHIQIIKTRKLRRDNSESYLIVMPLSTIVDWEIEQSPYQSKSDVAKIYSSNIEVIKENDGLYDIKLNNAYLLTVHSDIGLDEELPVLVTNESVISIILKAILEINEFMKLIETKSNKISSNSTKIMTIHSLERLLNFVFDGMQFRESQEMIIYLKKYIQEILVVNELLTINTVKGLQELKRISIINSVTSWYIIFKYFFDNYKTNVYKYIDLPKLDINISIGKWSGTFFSKDNPIWDEIYGSSRKFYPTKTSLDKSYKYWIDFVKSL